VRDYGFKRLPKPMEFNRYSVRYKKNEIALFQRNDSYWGTKPQVLSR